MGGGGKLSFEIVENRSGILKEFHCFYEYEREVICV